MKTKELKQQNIDLWYFLVGFRDRYFHSHWNEMFEGKALWELSKEELAKWMDKCNEIAKQEISDL